MHKHLRHFFKTSFSCLVILVTFLMVAGLRYLDSDEFLTLICISSSSPSERFVPSFIKGIEYQSWILFNICMITPLTNKWLADYLIWAPVLSICISCSISPGQFWKRVVNLGFCIALPDESKNPGDLIKRSKFQTTVQ